MIEINREFINKKIFPAIIYIMFAVGILGHIVPLTHDLMIFLTPFFLFGMGIFVIHPSIVSRDIKTLVWILITYIVTFTTEVVGVKTGLVFGEYIYGSTLGLHLFEVPVVIGFNWVLVVIGAVLVAQKLTKNIYVATFLGGLFSMVFDIFLEPVAIEFDYWTWAGGDIPLQNYVAWFVIAAIFSFIFLKLKVKMRSDLTIHYLFIQAIFFLSLQLSFYL
jgi:putative membrane protein